MAMALVSAAILTVGGGSAQAVGLGTAGPLAWSHPSPVLGAENHAARKPKGATLSGGVVRRVVDGDTLIVALSSGDVTVRMIGINAPESVKPNSPVECVGPEASAFSKGALTGRTVTLEFDASQGRTDQYGRTLAYVRLERSGGGLRMFNLAALTAGSARERQYGPTPYAWRSAFRAAQGKAQRAHAGLWGACA